MKILITGADGMLGKDLQKVLAEDPQITVLPTDRAILDITQAESIEEALQNFQPDILINSAAFTDVNAAEDEGAELNQKINAQAPGILAAATKKHNCTFVHISTDYVFGSNATQAYTEADIPKKQLNAYGKAKYKGELNVQKQNPAAFIVRTSWLYGEYGKNFVDTMLKLGSDRDELSIVTDEIGVPTWTIDLARQLHHLVSDLKQYQPGIYHAVSEGSCSRFEQAEAIFAAAGMSIKLNETTLNAFDRKAQVPNISMLKNTRLPKMPHWKDSIQEYAKGKFDRS